MRKFLFKKRTLFFKKGFTLVELILALAIMSILSVAISAAMSFGSDYYIKNRKVAQATSYANDIVNGINAELYSAFGAYIEHEAKTDMGASLAFSDEPKYSSYGRRIYLDTSTYRIVCQNKDGSQCDTLKSRYQKDLYVKNLMFEVKQNPAYEIDGVAASGMFDAYVDNILVFSFQIYDAENLRLLYEVKNFSVVLDNMVNQINNSSNVSKEASVLRAMLLIGHGEIENQIIQVNGGNVAVKGVSNEVVEHKDYFDNYAEYKEKYLDFDNDAYLNDDKNLKAHTYNILYYDIEP